MTAVAGAGGRSIWLLMLGLAAVGIQALMFSPLLTDIARGLETGAKEMGLASAAYGVGVAISALVAAPKLGVWPKRTVIRIAFAVMAAGLALCSVGWAWPLLAAGQFVAGLASGVIIPATYALTGDISPPETRSQALGRVLTGWSVAMVAGVPLAAMLSALAGWRGTFVVVAVLAAAMALALGLLPKVAAAESNERVRYGDVLRLPGAFIGYAATFAYMIGFYQTYTFIGDHVRNLHGAGAWLAGAITLSYGLGFGGGVIFDKWIDARGPRRVMVLGLFLVGLNYLALPYATQSVAATMVYPLLWGLANHLCMTAIVSFLGSLSTAMRGTIMGLFSFVTYVALAAGGALYGAVYDVYGFFAVSFAATATLWIAALVVQQLLNRKKA